jgi:DNA polymerase-3 subunit delta
MLVTLSGDNDYLIKQELSTIVSDFKKANGDLAIESFESDSELSAINEAINNVNLLSPDKLIILRQLSDNKDFVGQIDKILEGLPSGTNLVLVEPNLDKRLSIYKTLVKLTDLKAFTSLKDNDELRWVVKYATDNKAKITNQDARHLIDRAGNNQLKLAHEIDKLLLYDSNITKETIDLLVEDNYQNNIFQLIDAAFSNKLNSALSILGNLRSQKIEPPQIIAMLAWQLNIISIIKYAGNKEPAEIAKDSKQNPFVINKNRAVANKISLDKLKRIANQLFTIDLSSKTNKTDVDEALLNFILELAS